MYLSFFSHIITIFVGIDFFKVVNNSNKLHVNSCINNIFCVHCTISLRVGNGSRHMSRINFK